MKSAGGASPRTGTATAVILRNGELLLQLRDSISTISYPGVYSLVSGARSTPRESPIETARRELSEEIEVRGGPLDASSLTIVHCASFMRFHPCYVEHLCLTKLDAGPEEVCLVEGAGWRAVDDLAEVDDPGVAPPHEEALALLQLAGFSFGTARMELGEELVIVANINDYLEFVEHEHEKDYPKLEVGLGYIDANGTHPLGAIHTMADAKFIALLEFKEGTPRGFHYHHKKVEHMIVLSGRLQCDFQLADDSDESHSIELGPGQMVIISPGCVHTYTALDGDVLAMEYAPQRYQADDVVVVESR